MKTLLIEALMPLLATLISIIVPSLLALLYQRFAQWTGIEIEARQREALQSALANGVRLMLRGLSKEHAIDYVVASVPDALKGLKVDGRARIEELLEPHIAAQAASAITPLAHAYLARDMPK
ncbi:hypothetical protein AX761_21935 [Rhizobium sp. 58]|nr:hypothetical protein AX761_21935 [Rhizobium sp. 58]